MMDVNATLIGQMITFAVFVLFTMKYVWPPITKAMQDREKKIADGLAAAEKGQRDLELAQHKSIEIIQEAKVAAAKIIDSAHQRATRIVEDAKENARVESHHLIEHAQAEIEQKVNRARRDLQADVSNLALQMAEKIVQRDIDAKTHQQLLNNMLMEIQ